MKKYVWLPLILMAVIGSAAVQSNAQSTQSLRAKVPFDFVVGDKTIEAGTIITHGVNAMQAGPVSIANLGNGQQAKRIARRLSGAQDAKEAKLVFHKYGDRHFLAEVWVPGYQPWKFEKSKGERAMQREQQLVQNSNPEVVTIAALLQ